MSLQEVALTLDQRGILQVGPVTDFEKVGRLQLSTLIREGLYPQSKVVGPRLRLFRGGYWLIHFLDRCCYFGVEPNVEMLLTGRYEVLEEDQVGERPELRYQ